MELKTFIRDIPDFPKKGIVFKDITPLLADGAAFGQTIEELAAAFQKTGATKVVAAEARGFIFGAALARRLGIGFVPVRKPGKLPYKTTSVTYSLEYGQDTLCMHEDAVRRAEKVLVIDDVLATGGTAAAIVQMLEKAGAAVVGIGFLIELDFLHGRDKLAPRAITSLIHY
jgi:adenine phosphoribosyltransferase